MMRPGVTLHYVDDYTAVDDNGNEVDFDWYAEGAKLGIVGMWREGSIWEL